MLSIAPPFGFQGLARGSNSNLRSLPRDKIICGKASGKFQPALWNRKVSPVALVPPGVGVSPGVDVLAGWRAARVLPVPVMRGFFSVHEGLSPAMEPNGLGRL
jgi:hypothetical protein